MLSFVYPVWLFGLLLLPLLGLIHWQQTQREHQAVEAFAREPLWDKMGLRPVAESRLWRGFLVLAAIACLLLALAQPRWGATGSDGEAYQQGSLVVLIDLSKSMWATDDNGDTVEGYQVHLGGHLGIESRLGRKLRGHKLTSRELPDYIERLLKTYQSERNDGENFSTWVARADEGSLL